jgi:hypothetical protein
MVGKERKTNQFIFNEKKDFVHFFWLEPKETKIQDCIKISCFSTGWIKHAIQAAPSHSPTLASVSLTMPSALILPMKTNKIFMMSFFVNMKTA